MSDDFEEILKRWLRDRAGNDRATLQALAGNVAVLPPRHGRRPSPLAVAVAVVIALGIGAWLLVPRFNSDTSQADGPRPPDPAAFAGDPRLDRCASELIDVDRVFEMTKARYFPLHFPGWWKGAPELEVDDPALVVIESERESLSFGGPVRSTGETRPPRATYSYEMCIAVGGPGDFVVHGYGPTWFDRIVPVLSAEDLERAKHMDPDVLADPDNYPVPQRLARCGGDWEYVFEANPAGDFPRYFPAALAAPEMNVDELATIVVYRDGNPMPHPGPSGVGTPEPLGPNERDLCVILGDPATGTMFFYDAVDITGFHVRLEDPPVSTEAPPSASVEPSITPSPAPAWTAGAAAALQCSGPPAEFGAGWTRGSLYTTDRGTPELALEELAHRLNSWGQPFPTAAFIEIGRDEAAVAFAYHRRGAVRAVAVIRSELNGAGTVWFVDSVAVCEASEFGPDAEVGVHTAGWTDRSGAAVPATKLEEAPDCYFATRLVIDGRLFVWAPDDVEAFDPAQLDSTIGLVLALPQGAIDTGYRSQGRELYRGPDGTAVYVVLPDSIQRWAHVKGDDYQRTDCN